MVEPVPFDEAAALIGAVRSGSAGAEAIPDPPVVVVDLDTRPVKGETSGEPLRPPAMWPCVVIAVSTNATQPPGGADVYLSAAAARIDPLAGPLRDLGTIAAAIAECPQAATTLAQVLRIHSGDVERDLLTESIAYAALQGGAEHRDWLASNRRRRTDPDGSPPVRVSRSGDLLEIVLDRPARRNAYSAGMRDSLVAALELAASDPTITEVHLRGSGPSFCSGGDLSEFGEVADPATAHQIRMARSAGYHSHAIASRLVAHVHGACVGAGVELPAFAGRVLADPGTTFRLPEVSMGLIPGAGGTASIPRRIGRQRTALLALAGHELDAETALLWGLVDEIVPA
ncbi:MAG TPA: enoyl-CoA hydratase/isomerase family protein [Acidimicrobiales bacterium]|nr:enoyl-CoA hydratase/isomerase family protein [Acidimicrobiales bacterium]